MKTLPLCNTLCSALINTCDRLGRGYLNKAYRLEVSTLNVVQNFFCGLLLYKFDVLHYEKLKNTKNVHKAKIALITVQI